MHRYCCVIRTLYFLFYFVLFKDFCVRNFLSGTSPSDFSSNVIIQSILPVDTELSRKTGEYGVSCSPTLLADHSARSIIFICHVLNILALHCRRHSRAK